MSDLFVNIKQIAGETCRAGLKFSGQKFEGMPIIGNYYINFRSKKKLKKSDFVEALKLLAEQIEKDIPIPSIIEDGKQKYSDGMDLIPYIYDKKRVSFFEEPL